VLIEGEKVIVSLKKREAALFYIIAGLIGIWIVGKVVFAPFHNKLSGLGREVVLQEARLKKGIGLISEKDAISKEYERYASYFSLQGSSDEEAIGGFSEEVVRLSRESGLVIQDMKPQKETKSDKFSKLYQINIRAEANMQQLVNFLYALHNSSLLFSIEKISLSPRSEESPTLNISFTIVGVSFS
jgi:hypothetical protein